jgi:hypothetical protein
MIVLFGYPYANHTRFHHALGCMHLMQKAVDVLCFVLKFLKKKKMHCILLFYCIIYRHGPFMQWKSIVEDVHPRKFLVVYASAKRWIWRTIRFGHCLKGIPSTGLCCDWFPSQLDMDRMDYLKTDSFIQVWLKEINSTDWFKWWMS